jgi:hypothetical protein
VAQLGQPRRRRRGRGLTPADRVGSASGVTPARAMPGPRANILQRGNLSLRRRRRNALWSRHPAVADHLIELGKTYANTARSLLTGKATRRICDKVRFRHESNCRTAGPRNKITVHADSPRVIGTPVCKRCLSAFLVREKKKPTSRTALACKRIRNGYAAACSAGCAAAIMSCGRMSTRYTIRDGDSDREACNAGHCV